MLILNQALQTQKLIIKGTKSLHFLTMNLTVLLVPIKGPQLGLNRIQIDLFKLTNFLILLNQRRALIKPQSEIPSTKGVILSTEIVLRSKRIPDTSKTIMVALGVVTAELLSV